MTKVLYFLLSLLRQSRYFSLNELKALRAISSPNSKHTEWGRVWYEKTQGENSENPCRLLC